jgi:hypothetical protein
MMSTERIRELNDKLRQNGKGGQILMTPGFSNTPGSSVILDMIRGFSDFTEDNDPHGERDFVSVEFRGDKFFAKIDYYAPDMEHGSEEPADPTKTRRVMTVMRADEY